MLVLALVFRPGEFDGNVAHVIPRVVDSDFNDRGDHLFVGVLADEYSSKIPAREHPGAGSHARCL